MWENNGSALLLDAGWGVGNAMFPLSKLLPNLKTNAFDFAKKAVELVQKSEEFDSERMSATQWDLVKDDIPYTKNTHDFSILIFVLSAIFPESHVSWLQKISDQLAPGGILYIRDYGKYDLAQIRFAQKKKSKVHENFYVRYDNTLVYYFTVEELEELMAKVGLKKLTWSYHYRVIENRKLESKMYRVWIQGKFIKQ